MTTLAFADVSELNCTELGCGTAFPECEANTFSIEYSGGADGVTGDAPTAPTSCSYNSGCLAPANTYARSGFKFAGWDCQKSDGKPCNQNGGKYQPDENISKATTTADDTITLSASWVVEGNYIISYDGKGGDIDAEAVNRKGTCNAATETFDLPTEITRDNSRFLGWKLNGEGNYVTTVNQGDCTENKTFVADWACDTGYQSSEDGTACVAIEYGIVYTMNGGENNPANKSTYKITDSDIVLAAPTRANSKFEGWYTEADFTNLTDKILSGSTDTKVVYAKWSCNDGYAPNADNTACLGNTITIAYAEDGGAEVSDATCKFGENFIIADATSRTGYTFTGWKLADGTVVSAATQIACNDTTLGVFSGTTDVVVAQWSANDYLVTYSCGDATVATAPQEKYATYDSEYTVADNTCVNKGYTFTGWAVSDTERVVKPGDKFTWNYTTNKTLTAQWTINSYECAAGEYLASGATECSVCEAGSYCVGGTYEYNASAVQGKSVCGSNSYSDAGAAECTPCVTGYTNSDEHAGIGSCKITCPAGEYVAEAGKGCVSVGDGYYGIGGTVGQDKTLSRNQCPAGYRDGSAAKTESDCMGSCTVACSGNAVCPENSIDCTHDSSVVSSGTHTYGNQSCNAVVVECPVSGFGCAAGYNKTSEGCVAGDMNAISYDVAGGTINDTKVESCNVESSTITLPKNVTKTGYTFNGWYDANGKKVEQIAAGTCTSAINLVAQWTINSYECAAGEYLAAGATECSVCEAGSYCVGGTYDYNAEEEQGKSECPEDFRTGGAGLTSESSCVGSCTVSCTQKTCPENSTDCVHGNEEATGTMTYGDKKCSATAPVCSMTFDCNTGYNKVGDSCVAGDMNAISYDVAGGTINDTKVESCNVESSTITLPKDVTKTGYTFNGWYKDGVKVTQIAAGTCTGAISLVAQWTACTPCNAGTGASCELSVVNNRCVYTTKCADNYYNEQGAGTPTPSCETCVKSCSGNTNGFVLGEYNVCRNETSGQCYRNCVVGDVSNAYAVSGTITANGNNGCMATSCVSNSYLSGGNCTSCDSGYTAPNNNTGDQSSCTKSCQVACSGTATCPSNAICEYNTAYMSSGTQAQGGKCSATAVVCPITSFQCESGYTKTLDGKSCVRADYKITYNMGGGQNYAGAPTSYTAGIGTTIEGTPTYAGYVFEGWCLDAGKTNCDDKVVISENAAKDVSVWAKWSLCTNGYYCNGVQNQCPDTHPYSNSGSDTVSDCYAKCEPMTGGDYVINYPAQDTVNYPASCDYNTEVTCRPGYQLVNGKCTACPYDKNAVTYGDGCKIDSCAFGYHPNGSVCDSDIIDCVAPNGLHAQREWDRVKKAYGICKIVECADDYRLVDNVCLPNTEVCTLANGVGIREWDFNKNKWGACIATSCNPGYTNDRSMTNEIWLQCGRCNNAYGKDGELAVSSYVRECEIATCMYQGELYALENNECRLICDEYSDETGRRYWDSSRKKCIHDCAPGFIKW